MNICKKANDNALVRRLIDQLNGRLNALEPQNDYSLEAIPDPDYWADEEDSNNALGRQFRNLVDNGRVPFSCAGWTNDRHNKYRYMP